MSSTKRLRRENSSDPDAATNGGSSSNKKRGGMQCYVYLGLVIASIAFVANFVYLGMLTMKDDADHGSSQFYFSEEHHLEEKQIRASSGVVPTDDAKSNDESEDGYSKEDDWGSMPSILKQIIHRSISSLEHCNNVTQQPLPPEKMFTPFTNTTLLPEHGIINDLSKYLSHYDAEEEKASYPYKCHLPPATSCNTTGWSVVFMAHDNSRLNKLIGGVNNLASRPQTKEIILVWNGQRQDLTSSQINNWNDDPSHPLRIFFHDLGNNLFNRWHPAIQPKMDAVLYFDDDGPFFSQESVLAGFELWKRNSGVLVGCFTRNHRFKTIHPRMNQQMQTEMQISVDQILNSWQAISPYDTQRTQQVLANLPATTTTRHPQFIPACRADGDHFEHNFNVFPQFGAHMLLPSGAFLHKDLLCFLWHPAFSEIREFVLRHPTHPDDVVVSAVLSQVTGKAPRVYTRNVVQRDDVDEEEPKQNRRKLLWRKKDWGHLRSEAINAVTGYFGTINPGTVGWCVGTKYFGETKKRKLDIPVRQVCEPEWLVEGAIPWMKPGGLGYDQC